MKISKRWSKNAALDLQKAHTDDLTRIGGLLPSGGIRRDVPKNGGTRATVKVYMKRGGATFEYDIEANDAEALTAKAREHLAAIADGGYRHCANGTLEWFPPHWIDKVKIIGEIMTGYPDRCSGT